MIYGYVRVSTKQQKIDRQYLTLREFGVAEKNIFVDKESGKDFERKNYQKLVRKLKRGDLLVIKSIDRLGRNYKMIIEEWARITKTVEADIKVMDMPLLDTRESGENLVGKFIADVVLQVLSFVAENERANIRSRQAEGIRIAKEKGVRFGRPQAVLPADANDIIYRALRREITSAEAINLLGVSRGTFFRKIRGLKADGA